MATCPAFRLAPVKPATRRERHFARARPIAARTLTRLSFSNTSSSSCAESRARTISWLTLGTEIRSRRAIAESPGISPERSCAAQPLIFAATTRTSANRENRVGPTGVLLGGWQNGSKIETGAFDRPEGRATPRIRSNDRPRRRLAQPFHRSGRK